ncbi:MAG TPA: hypothetical protein VFZ49_02990 [Pyrinomonadaceae bacterium]
MRRLSPKFHIAVMALALGFAAVYFWNGMSIAWSDVSVDLPRARAGEVLAVFPAVHESERPRRYVCDEVRDPIAHAACINREVFGDRDMSRYDSGGIVGCGIDGRKSDSSTCDASYKRARAFVWESWTKKKIGYIVLQHASLDLERERTTHLFIEPDSEGKWRVVERTIPMLAPDDYEVQAGLRLGDLIQVNWETATKWDEERRGIKPGTRMLRLTDMVGNSFIL